MATTTALNPYIQEWKSRKSAAKRAFENGHVKILEAKPEAFSEKEFGELKRAYKDAEPTQILAIGPFGSIYKRLIAPGLYKLNQAFEKATGKKLNLKWLFADIDEPAKSREVTKYENGKPKQVTVEGTANIAKNLARMQAAAGSAKDTEDGRLGYKRKADIDYIPAAELMKQLEQGKGKRVVEYDGKKYQIDLAIGTSLVDTHLEYAKLLAKKSITTVTEKPMVAPVDAEQVAAMPKVVSDKNKNFAADFFPYVDSMRVLEENPDLVKGLGKLVAIHGTCTEPGNIEPGRGWLLNKNMAGGGLFIADTAPHPVAWADYALNWYLKTIAGAEAGVDTAKAVIKAMDTYRLRKKDLQRIIPNKELALAFAADPNIETHGTLNAELTMPKSIDRSKVADTIELRISAGKGAGGRAGGADRPKSGGVIKQRNNKPSLGLELVFEQGRVELSTGYTAGDKTIYDPYLARVPNEPSKENLIKIYKVPNAKLGYNNMLVDWLLAAKGIFTDRLKAVSSSAKTSMTLLHNAYKHIVTNDIKPKIYQLGEILKPINAKIAFGWVNPLVEAKDHNFLGSKNF